MLLRLVFAVIVMVLATGGPSAQERQWSLDAGDQDAYLIFGVPDSDDVGVSLWCARVPSIFSCQGSPRSPPQSGY